MSQRTRARTTGAAAKPTNRAEPAAEANPEAHSEAPAEATSEASGRPRATARRVGRAATPATPSAEAPASLPLQPDSLARALRAVATELERDPELAKRVAQAISETPSPPDASREASRLVVDEPAPTTIGRSFRPTIVTGVAEALGPGVPDPFALRERLGEDGLREALASLRLGSLRAIIRQYGLDAASGLSKLNDAEKLRAHILVATRKGRS